MPPFRCEECQANHWGFPRQGKGSLLPVNMEIGTLMVLPGEAGGCKPCGCVEAGSLENRADCNMADGSCLCKQNVEGRHCDQCREGHFKVQSFVVVAATFLPPRCQETTHGGARPASATGTRKSASQRHGWLDPASPVTSPAVLKTGWPRNRAGQPRPATMPTR